MCSLEINEDLVEGLASGKAPWIKGWPEKWLQWISRLEKKADGSWAALIEGESHKGSLEWKIFIGDASGAKLDAYQFDYIWQDAFSPKKNSELWSAEWFSKLGDHSKDSVVLVTYSVARMVKDGLSDGGWNYEKCKGSGAKKQWMRATKQRT